MNGIAYAIKEQFPNYSGNVIHVKVLVAESINL